jgi:urate oxidase
VILADNRYGKSRVRMIKVIRSDNRHELQDLNVKIAFAGGFEAAHTDGDNSRVLPTDTMKNTVYALAHRSSGAEEIEAFALRLAEHFVTNNEEATQVLVEISEHPWARINISGKPHPHSFTRSSDEKRVVWVKATPEAITMTAGIEDLRVLKTTGSAFEGFKRDELTTLKEASDRIFATSINASWVYSAPEVGCRALWRGVKEHILETFAEHDSSSVQHTLYAIGDSVLQNFDEVTEISLSLPNNHCLLVDLAPFGMENRNEIYLPIDEPHGLIEATLRKN